MPTSKGTTPRQLAFGKRVQERRLALGLSQEKLANAAEIDRTYIPQLEAGMRNPSLDMMARLARVLECDLSELVQGLQQVPGRKDLDREPDVGVRDRTTKRRGRPGAR